MTTIKVPLADGSGTQTFSALLFFTFTVENDGLSNDSIYVQFYNGTSAVGNQVELESSAIGTVYTYNTLEEMKVALGASGTVQSIKVGSGSRDLTDLWVASIQNTGKLRECYKTSYTYVSVSVDDDRHISGYAMMRD